ncbi:hypothetical protein [Nocardioides sp. B-3]|uniref:hypothetical protein n=1 Tax=Nocardioides sp. B-3 TaxID=2895565 RepID=UPI002152299E|nr:hypothetical protein [Nocardioides sp. B-3]UUZ58662.1 hypothetical protein LP418_21465 [Nocardioides sp. B-3]
MPSPSSASLSRKLLLVVDAPSLLHLQPPRACAHPDPGSLGPTGVGAARDAAADHRVHRGLRARRRDLRARRPHVV